VLVPSLVAFTDLSFFALDEIMTPLTNCVIRPAQHNADIFCCLCLGEVEQVLQIVAQKRYQRDLIIPVQVPVFDKPLQQDVGISRKLFFRVVARIRSSPKLRVIGALRKCWVYCTGGRLWVRFFCF
jgi:hypothetical protein